MHDELRQTLMDTLMDSRTM